MCDDDDCSLSFVAYLFVLTVDFSLSFVAYLLVTVFILYFVFLLLVPLILPLLTFT